VFKSVAEAIPADGRMELIITHCGDGLLSVTARTVKKGEPDNCLLIPLVVKGTPEELDAEFASVIAGYKTEHDGLTTNLDAIKADRKAVEKKAKSDAKKEAKKKPASKKAGAKGTAGAKDTAPEDPDKNRKEGSVSADDVSWLTTTPASDANFQGRLKKASVASLEKALQGRSALTNKEAIAAELAKLTNKTKADILVPVLTEGYKAVTDPRSRAGLALKLEKLTGKTIKELGLPPVQPSLLDTIPGSDQPESTT